jgi:AraC-like DNA-binding protein
MQPRLLPVSPPIDLLATVLERTGLRGRVYCRSTGRAPWGLDFDGNDGALFHLIVSGTCWLLRGARRTQLVAGDVVLVPRGAPHALVDHPRSKRIRLVDWLKAPPGASSDETIGHAPMRLGSASGDETEVLCGVYEFTTGSARHPVLRLLPDWLHVRSHGGHASSDLEGTIASLRGESERGARGSTLVVSRLLDVLFVQIVRAWAEAEPPGKAGWIGALEDPILAQALAAMHAEPARAWTVETLARASGASRATLARRFVAEVGEPPLAYLTRIRLEEAARRLTTSPDALAEVAASVGYTSEFAFSRAFRRELGVAPGRYRESARPGS